MPTLVKSSLSNHVSGNFQNQRRQWNRLNISKVICLQILQIKILKSPSMLLNFNCSFYENISPTLPYWKWTILTLAVKLVFFSFHFFDFTLKLFPWKNAFHLPNSQLRNKSMPHNLVFKWVTYYIKNVYLLVTCWCHYL